MGMAIAPFFVFIVILLTSADESSANAEGDFDVRRHLSTVTR